MFKLTSLLKYRTWSNTCLMLPMIQYYAGTMQPCQPHLFAPFLRSQQHWGFGFSFACNLEEFKFVTNLSSWLKNWGIIQSKKDVKPLLAFLAPAYSSNLTNFSFSMDLEYRGLPCVCFTRRVFRSNPWSWSPFRNTPMVQAKWTQLVEVERRPT